MTAQEDWRDAERKEMNYCMMVAKHELENPPPKTAVEMVIGFLCITFAPPLMLGWMVCSGLVAAFIGEGFPAYAIGSLVWQAVFFGFFWSLQGKTEPDAWDVYRRALKIRQELQLRKMREKA